MVGGHTRNIALKESGREFAANFKSKQKSEMWNKRINWTNKIRPATGKMILATVQKQTQEAPQKQGGEAISSISVQSETVSETNTQYQNTETKNLWETIWLLKKDISAKEKTIFEKDKTIEKMTEREQEMEKRDSKQNNEMEK